MESDTLNRKEQLQDSILISNKKSKRVKRKIFKNIWYNQELEIKENIDMLFSEEKVTKIKNLELKLIHLRIMK